MALRSALRSLDLPYSRAILESYRHINHELWAAYRRGEVTPRVLTRERFRRLLGRLGVGRALAPTLARRYVMTLATRGDLRPSSRATLRRLARRCRLATVTNGTDRVQRARLRAARIDHYFDAIVTSEKCGFAKPDPRIISYALRSLGVSPEHAVMVGDDPETDGLAAARAGVRFCWYDDGKPRRAGAPRPPCRITALPDLLERLVR